MHLFYAVEILFYPVEDFSQTQAFSIWHSVFVGNWGGDKHFKSEIKTPWSKYFHWCCLICVGYCIFLIYTLALTAFLKKQGFWLVHEIIMWYHKHYHPSPSPSSSSSEPQSRYIACPAPDLWTVKHCFHLFIRSVFHDILSIFHLQDRSQHYGARKLDRSQRKPQPSTCGLMTFLRNNKSYQGFSSKWIHFQGLFPPWINLLELFPKVNSLSRTFKVSKKFQLNQIQVLQGSVETYEDPGVHSHDVHSS